MTQSSQQTASNERSDKQRSPAEWTTLIVMLLIISTLVGVLVWRAFTGGDDATFTVTIDHAAIDQRGDTFQVPIEVFNEGHAPAEDVLVHVALLRGDATIEETELTFHFLGGGETADGVALFVDDPRANTLEAHVTSFLVP
jgi:uncharacterized protein (TIGR02588 family)